MPLLPFIPNETGLDFFLTNMSAIFSPLWNFKGFDIAPLEM